MALEYKKFSNSPKPFSFKWWKFLNFDIIMEGIAINVRGWNFWDILLGCLCNY